MGDSQPGSHSRFSSPGDCKEQGFPLSLMENGSCVGNYSTSQPDLASLSAVYRSLHLRPAHCQIHTLGVTIIGGAEKRQILFRRLVK